MSSPSKRSEFIRNFLHDVLDTTKERAEIEACTLEHHLSDQSLRRLGLLYQFLNHCPKMENNLLAMFKKCVNNNSDEKSYSCIANIYPHLYEEDKHLLLETLPIGEKAKIMLLSSEPKMREFFLSKNLLPGIEITMQEITENFFLVSYKNQKIEIPREFGASVEVSIVKKSVYKDNYYE